MKTAIKNIIDKGGRDRLVISMFTYAHNRTLTDHFYKQGLKELGIDYADVLLLGYFSKKPPQRLIDGALELKEKGLVRFIGLSSHNRQLFPSLYKERLFDVFHLRYNAAHRGAETETFPFIKGEKAPGIVSFTATRWRRLLNPKKMPPGEQVPTAADCYRFVLSQPAIDVCMMGAANEKQMAENLKLLDLPAMTTEELEHMRRIGDFQYGKNR
jgi:aryl-alcohol dehydrogenase-like predicted oxidoreductase